MTIEWWLLIIIGIVGLIVQGRLQSVFSKYSKVPMTGGLTGREVAEKMLRDNGIHDVTVTSTRGHLTDNYNPTNKTINLSESVYASNSIAAAAVAAHETGHAIQDAYGYAPPCVCARRSCRSSASHRSGLSCSSLSASSSSTPCRPSFGQASP